MPLYAMIRCTVQCFARYMLCFAKLRIEPSEIIASLMGRLARIRTLPTFQEADTRFLALGWLGSTLHTQS